MKGMLNFLEKAGLVSLDPERAAPAAAPLSPDSTAAGAVPAAAADAPVMSAPAPGSGALDLAAIFTDAGVAPSRYPAERLLRVVDGLAAMDAHTRHLAIRAIDEADESWTIDDPVADAQAKVAVLDAYRADIATALAQIEADTRQQIGAVQARREQVVTDVRRQIGELEALIAREQGRAAQEEATLEAGLAGAREQTARQTAELDQARARLASLTTQFGAAAPAAPQ